MRPVGSGVPTPPSSLPRTPIYTPSPPSRFTVPWEHQCTHPGIVFLWKSVRPILGRSSGPGWYSSQILPILILLYPVIILWEFPVTLVFPGVHVCAVSTPRSCVVSIPQLGDLWVQFTELPDEMENSKSVLDNLKGFPMGQSLFVVY